MPSESSLSSRSALPPVSAASVVSLACQRAALADTEAFDHFRQLIAVIGEVLLHFEAVRECQDGYDIGGAHLRVQEFLRGGLGADLIRGRHGREVEQERDETAVAV